MRQRIAIVLFCLLGVALNVWLACGVLLRGAWTGRNDFLSFYAGARLAGTVDLYSREAARDVQLRATGENWEALRFIRLPYYALLMKPLALLPYRTAVALWVALGVGALAAFAALWPGGWARWVICCWFLPSFVSLFNGQDASFVVLWVALAALLVRRERLFWAGMVLALCASKYHLAVLLPVAIAAQRRWRVALGGVVGGTLLIAISFAAAPWNWPSEYYSVLTDSRIHPSLIHMPSLHGMQLGVAAETIGVALLAASVYLAARRSSFEWAMALALAAGLLASFHSYLADSVVLLPALIQAVQVKWLRPPAIALATTVPWLLLQLAPPLPNVTRALILLLVLGSALTLLRQRGRLDEHPGIRI